jgi:hypothetical protein
MSKYFSPKFKEKGFSCPHCGVYANQYWSNLNYYDNGSQVGTNYGVAKCSHCNKLSFWDFHAMIYPKTTMVVGCSEDMPGECKSLYQEAQKIFQDSPRACAGLLRLLVQKLMPYLGEKGKNINEDIASLVKKGLPEQIQQALDVCRVVGNNGVHPGDINLEEDSDIVLHLFDLINFIVEDRISRPKAVAQIYAKLPAPAVEAIVKRDGS